MSESSKSESYQVVHDALKKMRQSMLDLSMVDLSKIHVDQNWSWVPYFKDHADFLVEQIEGLIENLRDCPPPVAPKNES